MLGLADDLFALGPRDKLLGVAACFAVEHVVAQAFVLASGLVQPDGSSKTGAAPAMDEAQWLALAFCLAGTNAVNLSDNMDGLAASLAAVSAGSIAALLDQPQQGSPALALLGACLGYLVWNAPPARVFMGDAGSMGLGYLLSRMAYEAPRACSSAHITSAGDAVLSLRGRAWALLVSVLLLAVPATDSLATLARRIVERRPIFRGSTDHLSHTLARKGLREPGSVLVLQCAQAAAGMAAIGVGRRLRSWLPEASGHSARRIDRGMWPAIAAAGVAGVLIIGCWLRGRCR
jgi:UDP-GlcNAc:undecaprenyl-phosphate GlcNAc-1-phosphate transferase